MVPTYGTPPSPGFVQTPSSAPWGGTEFIPSSTIGTAGVTGVTSHLTSEVQQLQFTPPPASFVGRNRHDLIERRFFNSLQREELFDWCKERVSIH